MRLFLLSNNRTLKFLSAPKHFWSSAQSHVNCYPTTANEGARDERMINLTCPCFAALDIAGEGVALIISKKHRKAAQFVGSNSKNHVDIRFGPYTNPPATWINSCLGGFMVLLDHGKLTSPVFWRARVRHAVKPRFAGATASISALRGLGLMLFLCGWSLLRLRLTPSLADS